MLLCDASGLFLFLFSIFTTKVLCSEVCTCSNPNIGLKVNDHCVLGLYARQGFASA